MSDKKPTLVHDAEPSPLSNLDIVWAMQSRLVTSNKELGEKTQVIQSHLSTVSNSLVDELQILAEELSDRLTL